MSTDDDRAKGRGERIAEHMETLGLSSRKVSHATGLDPQTIARVLRGEARPASMAAVETYLADYEALVHGRPTTAATAGGGADSADPAEGGLVEFRVEGVLGVQAVVVRGPVGDVDALERSIANILRQVQAGDQPDGNGPA